MNSFRIARMIVIAVLACVVTGCVVLPYGDGRGSGYYGNHHGFARYGHFWGRPGHW